MSRVVSIKYFGIQPVYNMKVEKNHNFITPKGTVLHNCDALRYYCISRIMPTFQTLVENPDYDELEGTKEEYEEFMCGDGEPSADYINA